MTLARPWRCVLFFARGVTALDKTIRAQAIRLTIVYSLLIVLCIWQREFIWVGIAHNVYLNGMIFGVFIFGSVLVFRSLFTLRNDVVAYRALKSLYDDAQIKPAHALSEAELRARCLKPGIVYKPSQLMGHVFDLTIEELLRNQQVRISIATMQNLIQAVDARISHQRSLNNYLTSLCIFIGLIGTFIGLMEMVASVGGIIGGLANTDSGSTDTVRQLIRNLERPLTGMAQGFSASLFGLTGSLLIGLAGRLLSIAIHSLREEFEKWLAGISQIDSEAATPTAVSDDSGVAGVGPLFQRLGNVLRLNTERLEQQIEALERASRQMERVAANEQKTMHAIARIEALQGSIAETRDAVNRQADDLRNGVLEAFERLARFGQEQQNVVIGEFGRLAATGADTQSALQQIVSAQERIAQASEDRQALALQELRAILADKAQTGVAIAQVAESQSQLGEILRDLGRESGLMRGDVEKLAARQAELASVIGNIASNQSMMASGQAEQAANARVELARLLDMQERNGSVIQELAAAQDRLSRSGAEQQSLTLSEISQMRHVQTRADAILMQLAALEASKPSEGTITTIIGQSVGSAVSELARAMEASMRSLTQEMARMGGEQQRLADAAAIGGEQAFINELRELSRSLQSGLNTGLQDIVQTLDATLATYTDALRELAARDQARALPPETSSKLA
jgi:hypothetical protein